MKVVHLSADEENYIEVGERRFLVFARPGGGCDTIPATCPHRGGPLHLGAVEESGQFIVCPWHQTKVSLARLQREALPTVSSLGRVSVVIAEGEAHAYRRKTLLDGGAGPACAGGNE